MVWIIVMGIAVAAAAMWFWLRAQRLKGMLPGGWYLVDVSPAGVRFLAYWERFRSERSALAWARECMSGQPGLVAQKHNGSEWVGETVQGEPAAFAR